MQILKCFRCLACKCPFPRLRQTMQPVNAWVFECMRKKLKQTTTTANNKYQINWIHSWQLLDHEFCWPAMLPIILGLGFGNAGYPPPESNEIEALNNYGRTWNLAKQTKYKSIKSWLVMKIAKTKNKREQPEIQQNEHIIHGRSWNGKG